MGLSAKTKILDIGGSKYFLIPLSIKSDSQFPFKMDFLNPDDDLIMTILQDKIIIQNIKNIKEEEYT